MRSQLDPPTPRPTVNVIAGLGFLLILVFSTVALVVGCGPELPDPESPAAQLYVNYCSGSGCHDPIPPQIDSPGYWNNQYERMIILMRDRGHRLPSPKEDKMIRAYLEENASR